MQQDREYLQPMRLVIQPPLLTSQDNSVTDVYLAASGGLEPLEIAFDATGQRVFIANDISDSVSIINCQQ